MTHLVSEAYRGKPPIYGHHQILPSFQSSKMPEILK